MYLSIIIPCFNEEQVIAQTYQALKAYLNCIQLEDYQLIFINDGSKDRTLEILTDLAQADQQVKYISLSRNFGKESAMLAGLTYAQGEAIIIMDADLQHPPYLIEEMLDKYSKGYDQVIARRTRTGDSKHKTFFARLYYKLVNRYTDVEMLDGVGDFRLLSRKVVDAFLCMQEYNRFSKGLFSWIGFKQATISYENQERVGGETKWSVRQLFNYGIQGVLSFNDKPLRICIKMGMVCLALSLVYIAWMLLEIMTKGIQVSGYFTTISAVLLIGGIQLLSVGILGEYVGKIYYEVKRRPHFLVQEDNFEHNTQKIRYKSVKRYDIN